jgi:hypothetical protein
MPSLPGPCSPGARTHTTLRTQPPSPLHPIGTRLGGGTGDELTARHRRPEPLHNFGDHPLRELRHHAPPFTRLPGRGPRGPPAPDRTARRSPRRLALGLGLRRPARCSSTGHGRPRKFLHLGGSCDHRENPRNAQRTARPNRPGQQNRAQRILAARRLVVALSLRDGKRA